MEVFLRQIWEPIPNCTRLDYHRVHFTDTTFAAESGLIVPPISVLSVACLTGLPLNPTEKKQNHHDDQNETQATAGEISPIAAVVPTWQSSCEKQDDDDN